MMKIYDHVTLLFLDLAMRHPKVAHVEGATKPAFIEEKEWNRMLAKGGREISNTQWVMLLEEYARNREYNNGDFRAWWIEFAFCVGRKVDPKAKQSEQDQALDEGHDIAEEMVDKLIADSLAGSSADLPPGLCPATKVDERSIRIIPIKLPLFPNVYGVRCTGRLLLPKEPPFSHTRVNWLPHTAIES